MVLHVLLKVFVFIRYFIDYFIDWVFGLYFNSRKQFIKKVSNPILLESAVSLARKIREGKITSEKLVQAFIDRINEVNPILNAVVDERFSEALEEAKTIDNNIANGKYTKEDFDCQPFLGIPFTTKETTACKGLKNSFALVCRKDIVASEDAEVIMKMKKAGAILLGVTNIPQINMWFESYNPIYGRTNNPYDTTRIVGGSSGGEGSIIAACGTPFGIGTDIGGSIRIPSFMNGIFGHKCSPDAVSTKGTTYRKGTEGPTMVSVGPMAKYAEDILPIFKVLLSESGLKKLKLDEEVNIKKLNVYYLLELNDPFASRERPEIKECVIKVAQYLSEQTGRKAVLVNFKETSFAAKLWRYQYTKENYGKVNFGHDLANREGTVTFWQAVCSRLLCRNEFTIPIIYMLFRNYLPKINPEWAEKTINNLKKKLEDVLGDNGVLIAPSWFSTANYHYSSLLRPFSLSHTAIWNALKLPVTQVPVGLSQENLPLGVQVVAATNQDHICIAVAREIEKGLGGYIPPFSTKT